MIELYYARTLLADISICAPPLIDSQIFQNRSANNHFVNKRPVEYTSMSAAGLPMILDGAKSGDSEVTNLSALALRLRGRVQYRLEIPYSLHKYLSHLYIGSILKLSYHAPVMCGKMHCIPHQHPMWMH